MRTAIYSLFQSHELSKAHCFIEQVVPALSETRRLHILINDADSVPLRTAAKERSPHIEIHCEGRNLGVAGGRNLLIQRTIAAGAEFLISCDMDIVYDADYFDRMEAAFHDLSASEPRLGFLQPLLLDGRVVRSVFPALAAADDWQSVVSALNVDPGWRRGLWAAAERVLGPDAALDSVYHSGVSNLWNAHFGTPPDSRLSRPWATVKWLETFKTQHPTLRSEPQELARVVASGRPARVASAAGGVVAFHASALREIGGYDEVFNPFAYEDSELGLRSLLAGQRSFLVPNAVAIHDPFMGESNRGLMSHSRIGLLRGVEAMHPDLGADVLAYVLQQSLFYGWPELLKRFGTQLRSGELDLAEAQRLVPDFVASYLFDFLRGALARLSRTDRERAASPLQSVLRGLIEGDGETSDLELPLGLEARLVVGRATARRHGDSSGKPILSFYASNCRIEEGRGASRLTSRHFDCALVVRPQSGEQWRLSLDLQSDDHYFGAEGVFERNPPSAVNAGSLRVHEWRTRHKQYEYGRFSTEDIYPLPNLGSSVGWLPMFSALLDRAADAVRLPQATAASHSLQAYLRLGSQPKPVAQPARVRKILVFTDSRGQHKPAGPDYPIFGERLAADPRFDVDLILCPMKWTTTLDFIEQYSLQDLAAYDHVILQTGIVDWSPRRLGSAVADVYDNTANANAENLGLNTRDYSKKIVNNKKRIFDEVFGREAMALHLAQPFEVMYEGEATINMYSLEMARRSLVPRLAAIPNLIFISANRFVEGWRGDYRRDRPSNMSLTHAYADVFCESLADAAVIDLRRWSADEIRLYTCDNLHLSQRGSDWVYERLLEALDHNVPETAVRDRPAPVELLVPAEQPGLRTPERITPSKKASLLAAAGRSGVLATLVIGVRLDVDDPARDKNLEVLLRWIDHFYGDLFDVLLVEQDRDPRINLSSLGARPYVRHEFLYNPREYNRGWGYNVAVAHFCEGAEVVALMDTDVLTGANFVREIIDCHRKYDAISPYRNIYYTDAKEAAEIQREFRLESLTNPRKIKNPVTVAGGILIVKRSVFLKLKGFEQYTGYGCEDRALDVTLYNHVDPARIRIADSAYPHLWHRSDGIARLRFDDIYAHLSSNYGCKYEPGLGPFDFIHKNCRHAPASATLELMKQRGKSFADRSLYRHAGDLAINGILRARPPSIRTHDVIYPPDLSSLSDYEPRELYTGAPDPDTSELAALHNAFKGKRCFIIGNGPSLNKHDLSLLEGEYSFGVNSFFYKTRETGFRPYFYVVEDSSVMKENIEEIRRFEAPYKFFPTNYRHLHPKQPNTLFFRMNRGFYERSSPNYVVPRFSTDASKVLYCGQSVTYINLQLAYFLGFTEVHLIGMDFSYVIPTSHKRTGDVLLSDTDDPNHFHKDYFGKGKTWKDPKLDRVAMNYRLAKLVYESVGRRVCNATIGGSLEIFERVDYESLFRGPAVRRGMQTALAAANAHYRERRFAAALAGYVTLAQQDGEHFPYKRYAVDAYLRASEAGQPCAPGDAAFVRGLVCNL